MATKLTKKQQGELTEKLTGIIQKNNALQLRLSTDTSVNEMNVNQISGALNRIHGQAIGKELPTEITIPVKQLGSGDPSPDNIRPIVGYEIDGIGTVYGGELNIETNVLTVTYGSVDLGAISWTYYSSQKYFYAIVPNRFYNTVNGKGLCSKYLFAGTFPSNQGATLRDGSFMFTSSSSRLYVYIHDESYTDADVFRTASAGVTLAYEVATPETYTLTLEQKIQLLDQL